MPVSAVNPTPLPTPGALDQGFNGTGQVSLDSGFTSALDSAAVDSKGRIVVAAAGSDGSITVYRLNPDGTPDTGFGSSGSQAWAGAAGTGGDPAGAIAVDSSDRIYVTGQAPDPVAAAPHPDIAVLRLTADGSFDSTWNAGDANNVSGVVTKDLGGNTNDHGTSIAIDSAHVYVGAWAGPDATADGGGTDFALLSLKIDDGTPDSGFGSGGVVTRDFKGGNDTVRDIAVMTGSVSSDPLTGDIVAVGYVGTGLGGQAQGTPDDTGIAMFNPVDGALDTKFNSTGTVPGLLQTDVGGAGLNDGARSVAVDSRGRIYVSGTTATPGSPYGFVAAYKADGSPLAAFDRRGAATGGVARLDYGSVTGSGNAGVVTDAHRRAVVVGAADNNPAIGRLLPDRYAFDTTFGTPSASADGQEQLACPTGTGGADAVAVQPDSNLVVAGTCGTTLSVWRLGGGHQVPLLATPGAGGITATSVSANTAGRKITVGPGDKVTLAITLHKAAATVSHTQVLVGFVNSGPSLCDDLGTSAFDGAFQTGADEVSLLAPQEPGVYYLAIDTATAVDCNDPAVNNWIAGNPAPKQAQFLAEIDVDATTSITVTSSTDSPGDAIGSSASATPLNQLSPSLITSTNALAALEASPLRSSPLRSSPLRSSDITGAPLRSSPLRSSPLRSSPLRSSPLRSSPLPAISLSDVPFTPSCDTASACPQTWADILVGTPFAGAPLQTVTLQQLADYANSTPVAPQPPVPDAVKSLAWANIDLSRTAWRDVTLTAFLLGDTPLNALNTPAFGTSGWGQFNNPPLDETNTTLITQFVTHHALIDLELAGFDLTTYYHHDDVTIPSVSQLADAPLTTLTVGSLNLANIPKIGNVVATDVGLTAASGCPSLSGVTLAQLQQSHPLVTDPCAIPDSLLLGTVIPHVQTPFKISELLPGLVAVSDMPFDAIPAVDLAAATPITGPFVTFTAHFSYGCTSDGDITTTLKLPDGFRYNPGSASLTLDTIVYSASTHATRTPTEFTTAVSTDQDQVTFTATPPALTDCSSRSGEAQLEAQPGITLGPAQASAVLDTSTVHAAGIDESPVQVKDTAPPDAPAGQSTLYIGHLAQPGERDTYTLGSVPSNGLPAGTTVSATLSHIPTGADFDLSMFGPAQANLRPDAATGNDVNGAPSGTGVPDTALNPGSDGTVALPEPQTDVPVSPPTGASAWGVSDNRGNVSDSVYAVVPDVASGTPPVPITLVVSGFNGSTSPDPYTLLVTITLPTNAPQCVTAPATTTTPRGAAPASIPAGTKTLILTDKKRMTDVYGTQAASLFDTNTTTSPNSLYALAARPDVSGVVVPVEANTAVNNAYDFWDANPCSPAAANSVVAAINKYVDTLRAGLTQLRYIVIAGDDQILPMARVQDHVAVDNETTFANDETYKDSSSVLHDNQLSSALRDGYVLSDDAYADVNPFPWLNGQGFVPDIAVGRLVEMPADITGAIKAYMSANGVRTPNAAYTAGYDFNADGAQQVANTVATKVPPGSAATSINSTWTRTDAVNGMTTAAHGFISVNAHYDAYRALPAHEFTTNSQTDLLKTTDLPASLSSSILFTIGCHAGLSVADTFVSLAGDQARATDWAQAISTKGGLLAGNTGYGYGDDTAVAYSEKLMANFATNLNGTMTVGQALVAAKQSYLHLPLAAVDAKVMEEATFYGLPMYRVGATGVEAAPSPLIANPPGPPGTVMSTFAPSNSVTRTFVNQPHSSGQGTYWTVQDSTGSPLPPLAVPGQPLQPQYVDTSTPGAPSGAASDAVPHGLLVTGQTTHVVLGDLPGNLTNPVYSSNVPDGSSSTREPGTIDSYFPATIAELTQSGGAYTALLNTGQFRASGQGGYGFQQLTDKMSYQLLYSNSSDFTPPSIKTVDASVDGNFHVNFKVFTDDNDANKVVVLYLDPASNDWQSFTLSKTSTHVFEGTDSYTLSSSLVPQFIVQLVSDRGTVAESKSKGQDYTAQPGAVGSAPVISLNGALTNGQYAGPVTVSVTGGSGSFQVSQDPPGGTGTTYNGPFVISAPGTHTVHVQDAVSGNVDRTFVIANVLRPGSDLPAVTSLSPKDDGSSVYTVGQTITPSFSCSYQTFPTGSSLAITDPTKCFITPTALDNSFGQHSAVITAIAPDGNRITDTLSYNVQYAFSGFQQPINDPSTATNRSVFKINSTIPVKFQLQMMNSSGALVPIPDATASALANNCLAVLSYSRLQNQAAGVVDETVYTTAVDSGGCFRYDSSGHQFIYNLSSRELGASRNDVYDVKARLSLQSHDVNIGLK